MAGDQIATVRWGGPNSRDALYGSTLSLDDSGSIHLVNHLMPSGTTLQEWYSFTDYQAVRAVPSLPLLRPGRTYRIAPALRSGPPDTVIVDIRYFDRFGALLETRVLHPPEYAFDYPADCHHYTIRLLNGGCDELWFDSFTLLDAGVTRG